MNKYGTFVFDYLLAVYVCSKSYAHGFDIDIAEATWNVCFDFVYHMVHLVFCVFIRASFTNKDQQAMGAFCPFSFKIACGVCRMFMSLTLIFFV